MIDPDNIQIQQANLPDIIKIREIPTFEFQVYNLEDDKEYEHYIKDIEIQVRRSFEYRQFIKYLRENMNMNKCAFLKGVSNEESFDIKIEIHHYPFTLRDIVEIVYRKRSYYNESITVQMVAKEAMQLHYKLFHRKIQDRILFDHVDKCRFTIHLLHKAKEERRGRIKR